MDITSFRLPKEVRPEHYDLYLHPNLKDQTFSGKVNILIQIDDQRKFIALHQKNLEITYTALSTYGLQDDYQINIVNISEPTEYDIFTLSTEKDLAPGLYKLTLHFNGSLQDKIVGFYSSSYYNQIFRETR